MTATNILKYATNMAPHTHPNLSFRIVLTSHLMASLNNLPIYHMGLNSCLPGLVAGYYFRHIKW